MKSADEIKKELGEAIAETSWVVDDGDMHDLRGACDKARTNMADALALIQKQEKKIADLLEERELNDFLRDRVNQLEAERDALISDFEEYDELPCALCVHYEKDPADIPCRFCTTLASPLEEDKVSHWSWRGVQKED